MIDDTDSNYIFVGDDGVVFLVDRAYPGAGLDRVNNIIRNQQESGRKRFNRACSIFLKDGKTFFRSSMAGERGEARLQSMRFKQKHGLSLKHYGEGELARMITLRPEEVSSLGIDMMVQYYQPESERLDEGIASYKFEPVHFDYSHIDYGQRPADTDSKRYHIWTNHSFIDSALRLARTRLV